MNKRRKNSIDTITSNTSFNSSEYSYKEKNEKRDSEIKKEGKNFTDSRNLKKFKNSINERICQGFPQNKNDCKNNDKKILGNLRTINDEEKKDFEVNPEFENTEILRVEVKLTKDKIVICKLKRYDDVFETIKIFCEINSIDENLIKPLIMKSLRTLNTIYQIMNSKINPKQYALLKAIQKIK